jgi:hypothetical protein
VKLIGSDGVIEKGAFADIPIYGKNPLLRISLSPRVTRPTLSILSRMAKSTRIASRSF